MERNVLSGNNPVISFENYFINEMKFRKLNDADEENQFELNIGIDESKKFVKLKVFLSTERDLIEVEIIGEFKFADEIKEDEKTKFLKINGAAILYPYVVNFQQIYENDEESDKN